MQLQSKSPYKFQVQKFFLMNGFLSDDKIKMGQIHGNMISIYIQSLAEPLCVLPAFLPQTIFITESFFLLNFYYLVQIVRVISPSHKISFLHYSSIMFWWFFREYSECFDMHGCNFFSDS